MSNWPPELIADSVVSLAGLLGLVLFGRVLRRQQPRPTVTRRFLFAIQVVGAIMAVRLVQWVTGSDGVGRLTFAVASLVPIASLLVAEALVRRHAPPALKIWTAAGTGLFVLVAVVASREHAVPATLSLAGFQALTFAALAVFVLGRDRQSLSVAENTTIDRLALSLVLIFPLALTDFRTEMWDLPVRLSGIAILVLCWLGLTLRRNRTTQSDVVAAVAAFAVGLLATAVVIAQLATLDTRATVQVMAVILSVGLLALVYVQARQIRREDRAGLVLDVLADTRLDDHAAFLSALQTRALTSGALILEDGTLEDFDTAFRKHFDREPIVCSTRLDHLGGLQVAEQFEWFFKKFDASHAMLVSKQPFRVMALKIPALAQSGQLEQELKIAQRIAMMLAKREAARG